MITRFSLLGILLLSLLTACDSGKLMDENKEIPNNAWFYGNRLLFDVNIDDTTKTWDVFVNVRILADFPYSNLFVMVHQTTPSKSKTEERHELTLADDNGKWLGKGLGDLYDYQLPIYKGFRFHEKGIHRFELEQNMRNDTLQYIKSVGMRIALSKN